MMATSSNSNASARGSEPKMPTTSTSTPEFVDAAETGASSGPLDGEFDPGPGCRPCCSAPHGGRYTIPASLLTSVAALLAFLTVNTCHYLTPSAHYCYDYVARRIVFWTEDRTNCVDFGEHDFGLFSYGGTREGGSRLSRLNPLPGWFASDHDEYKKGIYETCYSYAFGAVEGFWYDLNEQFGPAHKAASVFSLIGLFAGLMAASVGWTACCAAFRRRTVVGIAITCAIGGVSEAMTLVVFSCGVCEEGCAVGSGAIMAIFSALLFFLSAILWHKVPDYDMKQIPIQCCCCPQYRGEHAGGITEVEIQRHFQSDGSIVTQKTTVSTIGFKSVIKTTYLPDVRSEDSVGDAFCERNGALQEGDAEEGVPLLMPIKAKSINGDASLKSENPSL